jgi:predicted ArsR family transcriptional regulator
MIDNKITIKGDPVVDIQRGAIGHRATWTGLTYTKAREAGKAEEAEKIIREAITETGQIQGAEIKSQCQDPESVTCFSDTFFTPNVVKTFEVEFKNKTEDRLDIEFHHCPLLKAWQDLGFDDETCEKLCDIAMDGDRNIAKAMGLEFHLGDTIANGCKTCEISFFKKGK